MEMLSPKSVRQIKNRLPVIDIIPYVRCNIYDSTMFKGRVCHYARITRHGKPANGKATEVRRVYLVCGASAMVLLECFVSQTRA